MKTKATRKSKKVVDNTTEEKIKEAARKVFTRKGFAAARTRDIAEEAGINLALLNYYFRSKEKLFDIIMFETIQNFIKGIREVVTNEETQLKEKIELIVSNYVDTLTQHPDLPLFILSELRASPGKLVERMKVKEFLMTSSYMKQLKAAAKANGKTINPLHYFMNMMALIVFPFVGSPIIRNLGEMNGEEYNRLMLERKKLIPEWVESMLKIK